MNKLKWLYPGMKIKRWLFIFFLGILFIASGIIMIADSKGQFFFIFHGSLAVLAGIAGAVFGFRRTIKSLIEVISPDKESNLVEYVYQKHQLKKGPKIVVIGGGTGLSVLLRGLKNYTSNLTAIVTVADDGGSSGQLRGDLGILPPGDIRNCLVALADTESLMEEILQYRFKNGGSLAGHNLGNLFLAAMTDITGGFDHAIRAMSKVLAIRGRVLPATLENIVLNAELEDSTIVVGESKIPQSNKRIKRVFLSPQNCRPLTEAVDAIMEADAVILGPGSLYTSILPNLLIKGIPEAVKKSNGIKVYVCNIMTQPGETDDYTASQHIKAIKEHCGNGIIDYAVVNVENIPMRLQKKYRDQGAYPVVPDIKEIEKMGIKVLKERLVYQADLVRHDPEKLARALMRLIYEF